MGNLLVVMQPDGQVLHLAKLRKSVHPQPEGIWIDSDGSLYLSSEGDAEQSGRINVFRYQLSE